MLTHYVTQVVQNNQKFVGSQHLTEMVVSVQEVDLVVKLCVLQVLHCSVVSEHKVSVTQDVTTITVD